MKKGYILLAGVAMLALLPMAGCASSSSTVNARSADMNFSSLQPLDLNVGAVQVLDESNTQTNNPRVSPASSLEK